MIRSIRRLCILPLFAAALSASADQGGRPDIPLQAGGSFSVPVSSMREVRFLKTVHQQYDFSCGSAALATLLTHHYNYPVKEQEVFGEMFARGDQAKIKKEGFSLLDIKEYLANHGFESDGFVADVEKLAVAGVPAIVLIKDQGYFHFVVVKGLREGRVLIGDPSAGTRAVSEEKFKELWVNKILFVIKNKLEVARFNIDKDWSAAPSLYVDNAPYRGLNDLGLPKYGPADF